MAPPPDGGLSHEALLAIYNHGTNSDALEACVTITLRKLSPIHR